MGEKFLGVDIAGLIAKNFKGKTKSGTLTKVVAGTRTPGAFTAGTNPTSTPYAFEGFVAQYKDHQIDGSRIQRSDRKIVLFAELIASGAVPEPGDTLLIEGATYIIQEDGVSRDPASATYSCHGRLA